MMSGDSAFSKCLLGVFLFVFTIGGIAFFGVGVWILVDGNFGYISDVVSVSVDVNVKTAAYVLMGVGLYLILSSTVGCCGLRSKNTGILFCYIFLAVIAIGGQFAGGIVASNFKAKESGEVDNNLKKSVDSYKPQTSHTNENNIAIAWDYLQVSLACCGAKNYTDYDVVNFEDPGTFVPKTCCVLQTADAKNPVPVNNIRCQFDAANNVTKSDFLHTKGCTPRIRTEMMSYMNILIGLAFGLTAVQVLMLILACCTCVGNDGSGRGHCVCRWRCC